MVVMKKLLFVGYVVYVIVVVNGLIEIGVWVGLEVEEGG